jgi:hypothetical protein
LFDDDQYEEIQHNELGHNYEADEEKAVHTTGTHAVKHD